jgi:cytochrome c oxidase subunit 4
MSTSTDRDAHAHAPFSTATYVRSLVALVFLTLGSFGLSYLHLGALGMPVALAIAVTKVGIVALFFMGLVHEPASSRIAGVAAVLFVILLASLSAADILTRF